MRWKKWCIFDYVDKFKELRLGVSADHYQDKESWMRYPKDIKKFENNLREAKSIIKQINCSISLLNVFDLFEIRDYYWNNFKIKVTFMNIVRGPEYLSIRNLDQKDKDMLILPHALDIAVSFTPVHNFIPKKSITESPFIMPHHDGRDIPLTEEQKCLSHDKSSNINEAKVHPNKEEPLVADEFKEGQTGWYVGKPNFESSKPKTDIL